MSENYLSIKDLVVEYTADGKTVHAVNGITLALKKGETLGLVGETGAGKTTIAKSILRILPDRGAKICSGEIDIEGKNLLEMPEKEMQKIRGNVVSIVFQDPMTALNPSVRVGRQISEVIQKHNQISKEEARKSAIEMLNMVGIPSQRFDEYPHQFSGGMKQRVVIAIALACNPELLLADEPTTALDVTIQAQVLEMILDLKIKNNTSMILITHDLGVVANTCDQVAVIYAGEIVEYGTKYEIFDHPSHPYTIGLFGAIPSLSTDEEWLHPVNGLPPDPTDLPEGCVFHPRCQYATEACKKEKIVLYETSDGHMCRCCNLDEIKAVSDNQQKGGDE